MHEAYMNSYKDRAWRIEGMLSGSPSLEEKPTGGGLIPKGEAAIHEFAMANRGLYSQVNNLAIFFGVQHDTCRRYNNAAQDPSTPVSLNEVKQYGNGWQTNQTAILKAKSSIESLIEEVGIDTVRSGCVIC
jgi:hypothetical protein